MKVRKCKCPCVACSSDFISLVARLDPDNVPCTIYMFYRLPLSFPHTSGLVNQTSININIQDATILGVKQSPTPRYHCASYNIVYYPNHSHPYLSSFTPHGTFHKFSYPCLKDLLYHDTFFVKERAVLLGTLRAVLGEEGLATGRRLHVGDVQ